MALSIDSWLKSNKPRAAIVYLIVLFSSGIVAFSVPTTVLYFLYIIPASMIVMVIVLEIYARGLRKRDEL